MTLHGCKVYRPINIMKQDDIVARPVLSGTRVFAIVASPHPDETKVCLDFNNAFTSDHVVQLTFARTDRMSKVMADLRKALVTSDVCSMQINIGLSEEFTGSTMLKTLLNDKETGASACKRRRKQ